MTMRLYGFVGLLALMRTLVPDALLLAQDKVEELVSAMPVSDGAFEARVSFKAGCVFGDADALNLDLELARMGQVNHVEDPSKLDPKVVVSLEPITESAVGSGTAPAVQSVIPKAASADDIKISLKVPDTHGRMEVFGLYVCIAHTNGSSTSCRNKIIAPFSEIFKNHQVLVNCETGEETAPPPLRSIDERLYFSRPVMVRDGKAYVLSRGLTKDDYEPLKQYLVQNGMSPEPADKALLELKRLGLLGSLALEKTERGIAIPLPFYKADKCIADLK